MKLLEISSLKPHEKTDPKRLASVRGAISKDGLVRNPILVDGNSLTILDGHHRVESLRELGFSRVPANLVDYNNEEVVVFSRRKNKKISKGEVLKAAQSGKLLPPRSSRHVHVRRDAANVPLGMLK
ncbi:MAG: ParB N-terminal domain-containing protein [Candidatus Micrarchaeota archaeon]